VYVDNLMPQLLKAPSMPLGDCLVDLNVSKVWRVVCADI
jgi:hypothetical protein